MSYVLECYNKSRNITDKYSLNNDSENKNSFRLLLGDAFSCVIDCFVLNDTKLVNTFDISYESVDWLIIKRDYVDIEKSKNDNYQSVLKFYIQDNYTKVERYASLTLTDNLTGDTTFLTIEQPACIYKIEVNDKDEDYALTLSENLLQYEDDIEVKVYGGHEKLKLYNKSLTTISLTKEYTVVDGKVTIDENEYTIEDDKVTINRKVYPVVDGKVTIDYSVVNNKVIINEVEYTVVDGKLANEYTVIEGRVTIDETEYTVEDGKVIIDEIEYTVENGKVVIKYDAVDGKKYTIVKDKVTIDGTEYTVVDGKVTINGTEYTVEDGKVTIEGKKYPVVYKVTIDYVVVGDKVTIGETKYKVEDGKVTINDKEYTIIKNKDFYKYVNGDYDDKQADANDAQNIKKYEKYEFSTHNNILSYTQQVNNTNLNLSCVMSSYKTICIREVNSKNDIEIDGTVISRLPFYEDISYTPTEKIDVFIDRGSTLVFDRHIRLSEVKTLNDMAEYSNGSYFIMRN